MDYYKILELDKNCSLDDIKKSYKKLAFKWHPDRNITNKQEAEEKFKKISEAYNVLSKPELRKRYDMKESFDDDNYDNVNPYDLFQSFFNSNIHKNNFFGNIFNNNFQNVGFNFESSHSSSFTSRQENIKIINGKCVKETTITDNNGTTQIQEVNGKIVKKTVEKNGKKEVYHYDDQGKFIKN